MAITNLEACRRYRERHPDRKKASAKKWRKTHPKKAKEVASQYVEKYPTKHLLKKAKASAKKRGLEFNITEEDIIIPEVCPYFGFPLTNIQGKGMLDTNISIDRIDSYRGYIKGNVEIISYLANRMKQNASIQEMQMFAIGILKKFPVDHHGL